MFPVETYWVTKWNPMWGFAGDILYACTNDRPLSVIAQKNGKVFFNNGCNLLELWAIWGGEGNLWPHVSNSLLLWSLPLLSSSSLLILSTLFFALTRLHSGYFLALNLEQICFCSFSHMFWWELFLFALINSPIGILLVTREGWQESAHKMVLWAIGFLKGYRYKTGQYMYCSVCSEQYSTYSTSRE